MSGIIEWTLISLEPVEQWRHWWDSARRGVQSLPKKTRENCSCFHNIRPPITNLRFLGNEYLRMRSPSSKMTATSKMLSSGDLAGPLAASWEEHGITGSEVWWFYCTSTSCCHVAKFVIRSMSWSSWWISSGQKATECNDLHGMDGLISF